MFCRSLLGGLDPRNLPGQTKFQICFVSCDAGAALAIHDDGSRDGYGRGVGEVHFLSRLSAQEQDSHREPSAIGSVACVIPHLLVWISGILRIQ
jgi:hypothetical protein